MRRKPPHILVTTPESLYILLTSDSGRRCSATVQTVIVDEIHALAGNKRGAHLALSLERLAALTPEPLGAHRPLGHPEAHRGGGALPHGRGRASCTHHRHRPCAGPATCIWRCRARPRRGDGDEVWAEIYDRLAELDRSPPHHADLRQQPPPGGAGGAASGGAPRRGARHLAPRRLPAPRLDAEQRLKKGELKALVATASLELGIDIGDVDLVCQLGSPRCISTFLQRVGRSGHAVGGAAEGPALPAVPRRSGGMRGAAAMRCAAANWTACRSRTAPLDVLAQQIVAEVRLPGMGRGRRSTQLCAAPGPTAT